MSAVFARARVSVCKCGITTRTATLVHRCEIFASRRKVMFSCLSICARLGSYTYDSCGCEHTHTHTNTYSRSNILMLCAGCYNCDAISMLCNAHSLCVRDRGAPSVD